MKKISIYMMALLSMGFMACNSDYAPEVGPQSNPQEAILAVDDITVSSEKAPKEVKIADFVNTETGDIKPINIGEVTVKKGKMPARTELKAVVEFSQTADFAKKIELNAASLADTSTISVDPNALHKAFYEGITHNYKTADLYVRTVLYASKTIEDKEAKAQIGEPGKTYFDAHKISFTPKDNGLRIADAYYVIGGTEDWTASAKSMSMKFAHSNIDVYDDPEFTITIPANMGKETTFAIGDAEALKAYAANKSTDKLLGPAKSSKDETGELSIGKKQFFTVAAGAANIKVTINAEKNTYDITPLFAEVIVPNPRLYLTGSRYGWGDANTGKWVPLAPVRESATMSWTLIYLHAGEMFKFAPQAGWGGDFGMKDTKIVDTAGMKPTGDDNITVGNAGWYIIKVDNTPGARVIEFRKPEIYLIGNTSSTGWDVKPEGLFSVPQTEDGDFVSPEFINSDAVRMCVKFDKIGWWNTEFYVNAKGQLEYRGTKQDDMPAVMVKKGDRCYLNITKGGGLYK